MKKKVYELPAVLTCFGYRAQYVAEMEGMLATVREHHPSWEIAAGRGPASQTSEGTLEVDSRAGKRRRTLPVSLNLEGDKNDFYKIVMMKAWWIFMVWREFADLQKDDHIRVVWMDADTRLNGPLDIEVEPGQEVIAGPWWHEDDYFEGKGMIGSGLLLFQGTRSGRVENILEQWSTECLDHINLPSDASRGHDCDDDILSKVLHTNPDADGSYTLLKLEKRKYSGWLPTKDGKVLERSLVDHWYMSERMELPDGHDRDWPPPEEYRRTAAVGSALPGWVPDWGPDNESPADDVAPDLTADRGAEDD